MLGAWGFVMGESRLSDLLRSRHCDMLGATLLPLSMPPKARPASATAKDDAPLPEAMQRLGRLSPDTPGSLDEIREELTWLMRNGLPMKSIEHVVVLRMALDPAAKDWAAKLQVERFSLPTTLNNKTPAAR